MKNKNSACSVGKTLFTLFLSVAVILTFSFVSVSFADTGNTGGGTAAKAAKIGSTAYDTVQEAIDAAKDGDTVVLQSGASADQLKITKVFDKDITFKGTGTLTMDTYGWHFYHTLTLDGSGVKFNVTSDSNAFKGQEPGQRWLIMCLAGTINVKNGASLDFTFDSSDGANTAIYAQDNRSSAINVENKSSLSIQGKNTKGKTGQGIQVGGNSHLALSVKAYSHFLIDGTNRGYVDSPTIDVENSDFTVQNCSSNASNGGTFTAVNSTVNFLKNSGHGLSADKTVFTDSTLNSKENGYTGVDITGKFTAENSTFNVSKNGWHTWDTDLFAGMRLRSAASIDSASALNINNNYEVGLHVKPDSRTAIADGAQVSIIDNGLPDISSYQNDYYSWDLSSRAGKMAATNGDGIYNQGTLILPKGAAVYNNHAINAGDDIYSTGTITFEKVGSGWKLDGGENNKARNNGSGELTGKDCSDTINGWFDDTETTKENPENARWEAHKSGKNHIVAVAPGRYTSTVAVKAAHFGIIQGVKKWDDTSNQDGKRPDSINVSLYANSHKIATHAVSTKDADSSDSSSWKFAFAGEDFMDASQYADENGKLVFTVADDDNVYPYTETSIGTSDNNYTITNKYDPQHVCIPVWVSWDDNQNQDNVRPDSVTVHVKGTVPDKTDASKTTTVEDKSLTLTRNGGWYDTDTLHNLPVYSGGQKITYTLTVEKSDSVNSGLKDYTTTVTGCAEKGFQVTNVYEPKTTNVTVTKKWSDNDSKNRPDTITVDLKGNGTVLDEAELDTKDQTDAKDKNTWTYTFKNVPVSKGGKALTYSVSENVPDGYTAKVVKNSDASFTITNTLKQSTPSGGGGGSVVVQPNNEHKVTFHPANGEADTTQTVKDGEKVNKPYDPAKSGSTFGGWYTDSTLKNAYDFSTPVKSDLDLYAKWTTGGTPVNPGTSKVKGILLPKVIATGSSKQTLTWTALTNVDGYYVYRAKCNIPKPLTIYKFKKVADVSASSPRVFKSYGLTKGVAYKYYVVGYKNVNGQKMIVQKSITVHSVAGNLLKKKNGSRYTNVKSVSVSKNAVTLKIGKTYRIQPSVKGVYSGCAILQKDHAAMFRYVYIKDGKYVSVDQNGKVKALKAGKCNVYVLGTNGVRTKVAVTVVK